MATMYGVLGMVPFAWAWAAYTLVSRKGQGDLGHRSPTRATLLVSRLGFDAVITSSTVVSLRGAAAACRSQARP